MFILGTFPSTKALIMLVLSMAVLMGGVLVLSKAGFMKNDDNEESVEEAKRIVDLKRTLNLWLVFF